MKKLLSAPTKGQAHVPHTQIEVVLSLTATTESQLQKESDTMVGN